MIYVTHSCFLLCFRSSFFFVRFWNNNLSWGKWCYILKKNQTTPCDSNITGDADCSGRIIVARGFFCGKSNGAIWKKSSWCRSVMWLIFHRHVGCHKESLWMVLHAILWESVLEIWHEGKINILPTIICLAKKGIFIPENFFLFGQKYLVPFQWALLMALSTRHFCWIMHSFNNTFGEAIWRGQLIQTSTQDVHKETFGYVATMDANSFSLEIAVKNINFRISSWME